MKIALFGPSLFELAVGLRNIPGNTVAFFVDERSFILGRELRDEPMLNAPNFARVDSWYSPSSFLNPASSRIVQELNEFDAVICSDFGPLFAAYSTAPFVFLPCGGDLTAAPFPLRALSYRLKGLAGPAKMRHLIADPVRSLRMRRGIKRATSIWLFSGPFKPWIAAIDRLGLQRPTSADCLHAAIDTEVFSPSPPTSRSDSSLTVFHPSRFLISKSSANVETGQWKGNDILLQGIAIAISQGVDARLSLIRHADVVDQATVDSLIEDLGLHDRINWLRAVHPSGFSWRELAAHYRSADIVADDFGSGWFGTVALEGAACGKPVIQPVDEEAMGVLYPDGHPFLRATDPTEVADLLRRLQNERVRNRIGAESRDWAQFHHNPDRVAGRCMEMLQQLELQ
jgi:glycosyltransferase involved in cell wall biosynthesis